VNDFCTEEQILLGCIDYSLYPQINEKKFLRFLMSDTQCLEYKNKILQIKTNEGQNLNTVFKIEYSLIKSFIKGYFYAIAVNILFIVFLIFIGCGYSICGNCIFICLYPCIPL
jgi:hypothetical protein